jgi:hypothetical protein
VQKILLLLAVKISIEFTAHESRCAFVRPTLYIGMRLQRQEPINRHTFHTHQIDARHLSHTQCPCISGRVLSFSELHRLRKLDDHRITSRPLKMAPVECVLIRSCHLTCRGVSRGTWRDRYQKGPGHVFYHAQSDGSEDSTGHCALECKIRYA